MLDCQNFSFSQRLSSERLKKAHDIFGTKIIDRLLCFTLFLLGVDRASISKNLNIPPGSIRSIIRALFNGGISALEDRRYCASAFLPHKEEKTISVDVKRNANNFVVGFGSLELTIPRKNTIQAKTVLLTLVNNGLISVRVASETLDFSAEHIRILANRLKMEDTNAFLDKRQGQQKDYVFTQAIKSEIIQQFSANAAVKKKTSSSALAEDIKNRCGLELSPRTIRSYIDKSGLSKIKNTLPAIIKSFKKNSKP